MVHPDYRSKILYPVLEKQLLEKYRLKYDYIISSKAPKNAERIRGFLGYKLNNKWLRYNWLLNWKSSSRVALNSILNGLSMVRQVNRQYIKNGCKHISFGRPIEL